MSDTLKLDPEQLAQLRADFTEALEKALLENERLRIENEVMRKYYEALAEKLRAEAEAAKPVIRGHGHKILKDGEPCDHPGCLSHITHPCEGCGRIGGFPLSAVYGDTTVTFPRPDTQVSIGNEPTQSYQAAMESRGYTWPPEGWMPNFPCCTTPIIPDEPKQETEDAPQVYTGGSGFVPISPEELRAMAGELVPDVCKWDLQWGPYTAEVECNDSIVEYRNDFQFCPFCGKHIEIVEASE